MHAFVPRQRQADLRVYRQSSRTTRNIQKPCLKKERRKTIEKEKIIYLLLRCRYDLGVGGANALADMRRSKSNF